MKTNNRLRYWTQLLLLLFVGFHVNAQHDSVKARVLIDQAWELRFESPNRSIALADSALIYSKGKTFPLLTARAYRVKALAMVIDEQIVDGMPNYDSAITYARLAGNKEYEASCYSLMAGMYGDHADFDQAIELYLRGYTVALQSGNKKMIAMLSNNLAESYLADNRDDSIVYSYFNIAYTNSIAAQDYAFAAMVEANVAQLNITSGNTADASEHLRLAAELMTRDTSDQYRLGTTLHVLASVYLQLDSFEIAIQLAEKSLAIMDALHRPDNALRPLSVIAEAYIALNKMAEAKAYSNRLLHDALEQNAKLYVRDGYKCLSSIARVENDPISALQYYEQYKLWNDSVFRIERERMIANMEIRAQLAQHELELQYETAKKDAENINLKDRNETLQRDRLLAVLACLVFLALGALLYFSNRKTKKINTELEHEKKLVEKQAHEKSVLVHEIHHRVKNNLTLLKSLLFLQAKATTHEEVKSILEECQTRIQSMAIVHSNLYGENANGMLEVPAFAEMLFGELAASFRANENDLAFEVSGNCRDVSIEQSVALGLILNELATNSIKYAFSNVKEPLIEVRISETPDNIIIEYYDNGPGLPEGTSLETGGFGFRLIRILSQQLDATSEYQHIMGNQVFKLTLKV